MKEKIERELGSFISFALSRKPPVTVARRFSNGEIINDPVQIQLDDTDRLSDRDIASLDEMMSRYARLGEFMPSEEGVKSLGIRESGTTYFTPNPLGPDGCPPDVQYRVVSVNQRQVDIAKRIATQVRSISDLHEAGRHGDAKAEYETLHQYLYKTRAELAGDFQTVRELEETLGMHSIGSNGNPQASGAGAVIFVIIEIYVS